MYILVLISLAAVAAITGYENALVASYHAEFVFWLVVCGFGTLSVVVGALVGAIMASHHRWHDCCH